MRCQGSESQPPIRACQTESHARRDPGENVVKHRRAVPGAEAFQCRVEDEDVGAFGTSVSSSFLRPRAAQHRVSSLGELTREDRAILDDVEKDLRSAALRTSRPKSSSMRTRVWRDA